MASVFSLVQDSHRGGGPKVKSPFQWKALRTRMAQISYEVMSPNFFFGMQMIISGLRAPRTV